MFYNDSTGYAVGWNGKILKTINAGYTPLNNIIPKNENNFNFSPNPFTLNATLNIDFSIINGSLSIFNIHGEIIKQFSNISGKTFTIKRDILSSGLYFFQLMDNNQIILSNKFLIID